MAEDNILIVAPYNIQINLLKRTLPKGVRVGTVDKFQGQEAEVVIVSMATSMVILCRKWEKIDKQGKTTVKVKGWDYFDFLWYLQKGIIAEIFNRATTTAAQLPSNEATSPNSPHK